MMLTKPITKVHLGNIKVGERYRKDLGDLTALAESIQSLGMISPIVTDDHMNLICGHRRLEAVKTFDRNASVPVIRVYDIEEAADLLRLERDENTCRKPFTKMEMKALADRLLELEKPRAAERKREGNSKGGKSTSSGTVTCQRSQEAKDTAAKAAGLGGKTTYNAIDKVQHHTECTPSDIEALEKGVSPRTILKDLNARAEAKNPSAPTTKKKVASKALQRALAALRSLDDHELGLVIQAAEKRLAGESSPKLEVVK